MRRALQALWACTTLVAAACHDPNAYVTSPETIDSILRVDVSAASIPADGVSRATITATITPGAANDRREITFTSTAGTLIAGNQASTEVRVTADAAGVAVAQLQSDTVVQTARLDVKVANVVRTVTISFVTPITDNTFTISASPLTIPADGFSESNISVELKILGTPTQRTVEFRTTAGTLSAPGANPASGTVIAVSANAEGRVVARLQSARVSQTARVSATALNVTRSVDVTFTGINAADVISLSASESSLPADGRSTTRMTATVNAGLPADRRTVTFRMTGTGGLFLPEGRTEVTRSAATGDARVELQADSKTGFARVVAEVDGITSNDVTVQLNPALPERIVLRSQAGRLHSGDDTLITAELRRSIGTVTAGTVVTFSATRDNGTSIGVFRDVATSNADGNATATFDLGTTTYVGPVTITASVAGGPSASIALVVE